MSGTASEWNEAQTDCITDAQIDEELMSKDD